MIKRQVLLSVEAIGDEGPTIPGAVVNADSLVGLEQRCSREPVVPKEGRLENRFNPRTLGDRQKPWRL
jgi:hypothetical protein